jgi:hypothetical protein
LEDINSLVGNKLPIQIPQVVVKWLTSALVLHIAALVAAAASTVFGLLAHVREMSMTSCSSFTSGLAAVIALFALIFDLVLFFIAKARIKSVGSAEIGSAIWLTFAAWVLLFFSGCFYTYGRSCLSNRPSRSDHNRNRISPGSENFHQDRQFKGIMTKPPEIGLPPWPEDQPLTGFVDGNQVHIRPSETQLKTQPTHTQQRPRYVSRRPYEGSHASPQGPSRESLCIASEQFKIITHLSRLCDKPWLWTFTPVHSAGSASIDDD